VGSINSSIEYNKAKDGIAIINKIKAGITVQTTSNGVECVNLTGFTETLSSNNITARTINHATKTTIAVKKIII
jgi:hypothetical protein